MHVWAGFRLRLRALFRSTAVSRSAVLLEAQRITLGRRCVVERWVVLKGGSGGDGELSIGDDVVIKDRVHIGASRARIQIGSNCFVGNNVWIGGTGDIAIGENCMLGSNTVVISSNHDFSVISVPYHLGKEIAAPIRIGSDVWVGANCVILPGVTVGDGAVVGAGAIVTRDIPSGTLAVGNPATAARTIPPREHRRIAST